jgi:hypothetical protein
MLIIKKKKPEQSVAKKLIDPDQTPRPAGASPIKVAGTDTQSGEIIRMGNA